MPTSGPNLNIPLDTPLVSAGPGWASDIETMKTILENHNHIFAVSHGSPAWWLQGTLSSNVTLTVAQMEVAPFGWWLLNSNAGVFTVTLPTAATATNHFVQFKDNGHASSHAITVNVTGGGLIDGTASMIISANYVNLRLTSDGTQWWQLN